MWNRAKDANSTFPLAILKFLPSSYQWLFLVPLKGGRWHIIPQLAVYTTSILPSGGLYATYHPLGEPETNIDHNECPNTGKPVDFVGL